MYVGNLWESCGPIVVLLWSYCGPIVVLLWDSCGLDVDRLWDSVVQPSQIDKTQIFCYYIRV